MNMPYIPNKPQWQFNPFNLVWIILAVIIFIGMMAKVVRAEEVNMDIIAQIESNNNPNAYNYKSGARGLYQITEICLKDYNELNGTYQDIYSGIGIKEVNKKLNNITIEQLFNPVINRRIAEWYLNKRIPQLLAYYNIEDTLDNRLWAYNAGIGKVVKGICPKETRNYIKKYHQLTHRMREER